MQKITLIATMHRAHGLCNSEKLLDIINRIKPNVIFEEISPSIYNGVYNGQFNDSLESLAIKKYKLKHQFIQVAVDIENFIGSNKFRIGMSQIWGLLESKSDKYINLVKKHRELSANKGFTYLNSETCEELLAETNLIEKQLLDQLNDKNVSELYGDWNNFQDIRENTMVKNIYNFSEQNEYNSGLFLVGAEHRKPIKNIVSSIDNRIQWNFNYLNKT